MTPPTRPIMQRFWEKVDIGHPDDCWQWKGRYRWKRYGAFDATKDLVISSHRMAYMMSKGPIPDGLLVCHTCDNPPCCNPDHLWAGTNGDNMRDSSRKGRARSNAKLTEQEVLEIRSTDARTVLLGEKYGVDSATIRSIKRGASWKHLL